MSSTPPIDADTTAALPAAIGPFTSSNMRNDEANASSDEGGADRRLIRETTQQINRLVHEITQLAQSDCTLVDFYEGFLGRVVSALAAVGGAIWTIDEGGSLQLQYQVNLDKARIADNSERNTRHSLLLKKTFAAGSPVVIAPQSGAAGDDEAGNPTDFLLVLGILRLDGQTHGIVEIVQRSGGGPVTHRGYLRFLNQMCALAEDFLKNRRLRDYSDQQSLWQRMDEFIHLIHRSLDPRDTCYAIANEGRRLIDADRVSVAVCRGRHCMVEVVSGLDAIDRRAEEVKRLGRLANAVVAAREPLWFAGESDELPPQIERELQTYLDKAHTRAVAVVPLMRREPNDQPDQRDRSEAIGALIVEQFKESSLSDAQQRRTEVVAKHSADALSNALSHSGVFLMPLWRTLGKAKWLIAARNLPKTVIALAMVVGLILAMCVIPAGFEMHASGTLQPHVKHEIFAPADGVLIDVPVEPGANVRPGDVLAQLENNSLEVEISALQGRRQETHERMIALGRGMLDNPRMSVADENRMAGELSQLNETLTSIDRQLELYDEKQRQLTVQSQWPGQVVTWQVRQKLLRRPVNRGQRLMTVLDPSGEWELEIHMPLRRMCHIDEARRRFGDDLKVTFAMATHPGREFEGRVVEIDRTADVHDENGNTVLIRVRIDKNKLPDLRVGAKVSARVACGQRSLGFVLFQDLIETVQTQFAFWF